MSYDVCKKQKNDDVAQPLVLISCELAFDLVKVALGRQSFHATGEEWQPGARIQRAMVYEGDAGVLPALHAVDARLLHHQHK